MTSPDRPAAVLLEPTVEAVALHSALGLHSCVAALHHDEAYSTWSVAAAPLWRRRRPARDPAPAILDTTTQRFRFYLIALGLLVAFYLLYRRFVDSPTGRVCAAEFLAWLREEDIPLAGARQGDLERWLATGTSTRRRIGPFLAWMAETRIGPRLSLPVTALGTGPRITQGERVELITRLFHDASVDLDTRVAGLFLLLFAQPVARTARLRVDDVKRHLDGVVTVAFGHEPAPLPCPLDRLTSEQLHRADATGSLWVLPGHVPRHQRPHFQAARRRHRHPSRQEQRP